MNFEGKVAIVTGGANGIGKAISTELLNLGMKLLICDVNENAAKLFLDEVSGALKSNVVYQKCDVSSYDEFKAAFEKAKSSFGRIDVVINNAGILNELTWKKMVDVNFIGVINGIHLAFEFMGTNNGGSGGVVINTGSNAGLIGFDLAPIYSGCKHGVVGLTKSYGTPHHYDKTGVKVNAVCPGPVDTQLFRNCPAVSVDEEALNERMPKYKATSPEEVAKGFVEVLKGGKNGQLLEINFIPLH